MTRRELDGFRVHYVWVKASPKRSGVRRIVNYGSYAAMAVAAGSAIRGVDVILASSPPLSVGSVGATLAVRHRAPWVMDVRDLWPEIAVAMGELRGARAIAAAERLERRLYRSAAGIVTVTDAFGERISERGGTGKVTLVTNGTTATWLELADCEPERDLLKVPNDRFAWVYAGNLGRAQGLEAAVDAAGLLDDSFELVVIGDGAERAALEARAAEVAPGRVSFCDAVPGPEAARLMRAADALLVPLADWPELGQFVPSKLFDSCAVGRPVIVAARGEAPRLAGDAALAVPPGDAEALAAAVRRLRDEPQLRGDLAERGRAFATEHQRELGGERVAKLLERLASAGAAPAQEA